MESKQNFKADPKLKLMDQVRQVLRYHHYAYQTEKTYCGWIVRYIRFLEAKKHPRTMGKQKIEAFLMEIQIHLRLKRHNDKPTCLHGAPAE